MVDTENVDRARYRVKMARQALRHSKADVDAYKTELRDAKLALTDAKIQVREHKRRGHAVTAHERRRSKRWFESQASYERRLRVQAAEEAPLR